MNFNAIKYSNHLTITFKALTPSSPTISDQFSESNIN